MDEKAQELLDAISACGLRMDWTLYEPLVSKVAIFNTKIFGLPALIIDYRDAKTMPIDAGDRRAAQYVFTFASFHIGFDAVSELTLGIQACIQSMRLELDSIMPRMGLQ